MMENPPAALANGEVRISPFDLSDIQRSLAEAEKSALAELKSMRTVGCSGPRRKVSATSMMVNSLESEKRRCPSAHSIERDEGIMSEESEDVTPEDSMMYGRTLDTTVPGDRSEDENNNSKPDENDASPKKNIDGDYDENEASTTETVNDEAKQKMPMGKLPFVPPKHILLFMVR